MRKMITKYKKLITTNPYNNEKGFIAGAVILLSLILLVIVTMAIWSSSNESKVVRNTGIMTQEFYDAESGIVGAINNQDEWLTGNFLNGGLDNSYVKLDVYSSGDIKVTAVCIDGAPQTPPSSPTPSGNLIANVQIRHINTYSGSPVSISDLWSEANLYPSMPSLGSPAGTGINAGVKVRRFAITAKDASGQNSTIQIGFERMVPGS